jgi:hypothetical protein
LQYIHLSVTSELKIPDCTVMDCITYAWKRLTYYKSSYEYFVRDITPFRPLKVNTALCAGT